MNRQDTKEGFAAGIIAGAVFLAIEMVFVPIALNGSIWTPLRMIAGIIMGNNAVTPPVFNFWILLLGLVIHFALSVLFTYIFILFTRNTRLGGSIFLGFIYGIVLYLINFYFFANLFFPWFTNAHNWVSIVSHLGFGGTAALAYKEFQFRDVGSYCVNC